MINPPVLPGAPRADPARVRAVKDIVSEALDLAPSATVLVQQLACREAGCPPAETVIAVLEPGAAGRRWTLPAPLAEVSDRDVHAALLQPPVTADSATSPTHTTRIAATARPWALTGPAGPDPTHHSHPITEARQNEGPRS